MPESAFIPVRCGEVDLGLPLPWAVYDNQHHLLLKAGSLLDSQEELDALLERGLFRQRRDTGSTSRRDGQSAGDGGQSDQAGGRSMTLDETRLAIGDPFQLQSQAEGADHRHYVRLIGYLKGKSVLVTNPEEDGHLCLVREGQTFVVRFFSGRNAYAFTTGVLRSSTMPFPHLHLGYPAQVRALTVRAGERVSVHIICAIVLQEGTRTVSAAGVLTNLSISGAQVRSKQCLGRKGDPVSIKFRLSIGEIDLLAVIDATVCTVSQGDSGEYVHGVQFAGLPDDLAIALTAFVYQKLAGSR